MTKLLLKLFVNKKPDDRAKRSAVGRLSGIVGILANLLLFTGKLFVGILSGSVSITADAMNNLSDATASIVTLVGFKLSEKPADEDHPYGHARIEYLSGLAVAGLILVIGFELAKGSFDKILHPQSVEFSWALVTVLVGSILVKLWLSLFNSRLGNMINSPTLQATASDSRNDCISTFAVLLAAVLERLFGWKLDGWFGMGVAIFILWSGVGLARQTISPLLGEKPNHELRHKIIGCVSAHPLVLGHHDLMLHDYGPGQRFATMHVEMDKNEDPMVCHDVIDDLERQCFQEHNVHLVIHYDPVVTGDEALAEMRERVEAILKQENDVISIHDFRMVQGGGHTNLIFDAVLPFELMPKRKEIQRKLNAALNAGGNTVYYTVITFDPTSFNG